MGFSITWDNTEKTILRVDIEGKWDWPEYLASADEFVAIMKTTTHQVDFISILHPNSSVPQQGPVLRHYRDLLKSLPDNFGVGVLVGGTTIERSLATLAYKIYEDLNGRILFANSLTEARQMVAERRVNSGAD